MTPSDLRTWKQRLGLTWAQVALATRIPESTLYDYLAGLYPIPADRALLLDFVRQKIEAERIADAFTQAKLEAEREASQ